MTTLSAKSYKFILKHQNADIHTTTYKPSLQGSEDADTAIKFFFLSIYSFLSWESSRDEMIMYAPTCLTWDMT